MGPVVTSYPRAADIAPPYRVSISAGPARVESINNRDIMR
jgi:hypothetical protein